MERSVASSNEGSVPVCRLGWTLARLFILLGLGSQLVPVTGSRAIGGEPDGPRVVIRARAVITASGETHAPGMIVIEGGKITGIGKTVEFASPARIIEAGDQTVMPGLVLARSRYGLPGYSRGGLQAARKASDEVFPSEIDFTDLLEAGFTTVGFIPAGSGIPGHASAYHTAPAGGEPARLLREKAYVRVCMDNTAADKGGLRDSLSRAKAEIEKVKKAREEWEKKKKEAEEKAKAEKPKPPEKEEPKKEEPKTESPGQPTEETPPAKEAAPAPKEKPAEFVPPQIDPHLRPLVDWIEGKPDALPVFELGSASDFLHLDSVLEPYPTVKGSYYLALGSGSDYRPAYAALGERKALVMLEPALARIPYTASRIDPAADLARAGCQLVFVPRGDSPAELQRVRTRAAELVRSGLRRETAIRALTSNPAKVLGLGDRLGAIEKGKDADLIFLDGDPLEPESRVLRVMVGGEMVWEAGEK
jgi:hypothetical protein